jgi:alkylation response protein AidB-like acyl-CoA dehydrogenase
MDFTFSEDQTAIRELARGILEKEVTVERVKAVELAGEWHDAALWKTLAQAGLLGIAVPEQLGGMGFGLLEVCVLLEEIGRVVAPVPVLPALVLGGLTITKFGSETQKERWLPVLARGEAILTAALTGELKARRERGAWLLEGKNQLVPAAHLAERILVSARTRDGIALFLVDPALEGVTLSRRETSRGELLSEVEYAGVSLRAGDLLGEHLWPDARVIEWVQQRATVATCAIQIGVSERALEMTGDYVRERVQFGVPIGSFQAVQHRAADAYIDLDAMRGVTWRAAWSLTRGLPAERDIMVAKFWAAEAGARIAASAQHLHAGIGVDVDFPIHRYFLWSKALELSFGGASAQLAALGRDLAKSPPRSERTIAAAPPSEPAASRRDREET